MAKGSKAFRPKKEITLYSSERNKRVLLTMDTELFEFLHMVRDPSHSLQETIRQILRAYCGLDKKPTNPEGYQIK